MLRRYLTLICVLKINYICVLGKDYVIAPKIINGSLAKQDDIRYQVSIRLKERDYYFGFGHICGGTLIKPSIVITAAHCLYNNDANVIRSANEFTVSMGSMDRFDRVKSTVFEVLEIFYKDTFNSSTYVDDLAIFILNGIVPENYKNIKPIEINLDDIPDESLCQVSGWGLTEDGVTSDFLVILDIPIVNLTLCKINYNDSVSEGMICAGYMNGSADACDGDSGGPLVCNDKLTGIVSFGVGCGVENFPGVYTDLKYHFKWIKNLTDHYEKQQNLATTRTEVSVFLILCLVYTTMKLIN